MILLSTVHGAASREGSDGRGSRGSQQQPTTARASQVERNQRGQMPRYCRALQYLSRGYLRIRIHTKQKEQDTLFSSSAAGLINFVLQTVILEENNFNHLIKEVQDQVERRN